jgi:release factor glutamine methyltransferase
VEEVVGRLRAAGCVFAEDEARLLVAGATTPAALQDLVGRRVAGEPLEHLLGWAEFRGLRMAVAAGVFVPRRRTEFLVELAVACARGPVVVDLCCGCGAVGAAVAHELRHVGHGAARTDGARTDGTRDGTAVELHAVDVDAAVVDCARRNVEPYGGRVYVGDLYAPLPRSLMGRVDVLVANAPYVPTDAIGFMPPEARDHEPLVALDGGRDGLDLHRRIAADAPSWLAPGGTLLIETGRRQAPHTAAAMTAAGLSASTATSDDLDATVVTGRAAGGDDGPGR